MKIRKLSMIPVKLTSIRVIMPVPHFLPNELKLITKYLQFIVASNLWLLLFDVLFAFDSLSSGHGFFIKLYLKFVLFLNPILKESEANFTSVSFL